MTTDVEVPAKRVMSQEQKDRMAAGRKAAAEAKKKARESSPPAPNAEVERLKAELAALKSAVVVPAPAVAEAPAAPTAPIVTEEVECVYEYAGSTRETMERGLRQIRDAEDPRWDGELNEPPFNGSPSGYLNVARVTRINGEIVKSVGICGFSYHKNRAQEFMRSFAESKKAGATRPWDQEHYHRELIENAEAAKREGRLNDLDALKMIFQQVVQGKVSSGSAVTSGASS